MPWRTIDGEGLASPNMLQMEVMLRGACDRRRLLDLIQFFTVFEDDGAGSSRSWRDTTSITPSTRPWIARSAPLPRGGIGNGVVWHTQGSGKSLSMAFYAGKIIRHPALANPR